MSVDTAQAFYERASSGAYRRYIPNSYQPQRYVPKVPAASFMTDQNTPARGAVIQPRFYNPASDRRLGDPNSHSQPDIQLQCAYLMSLAERETSKEVNGKELQEKEAFRRRLERIVQNLVAEYAKDHVTVNPKSVRLKCYGSLASGFAVPGSDMDLLLMFPKDQGPIGPLEVESRRMIEKALLDLGYGARLLTKTRVPILRVCQKPDPKLLSGLKKERQKWEEEVKQEEKERVMLASGLDPNRLPTEITDEQSEAATVTFAELDTEPSIIPLPPSPVRAHANLEYTADVGIQCDINFSNYVAIHNTALLRCYCKCDPRVRPMGLFVKEWSKARKINTPYHGTLSSYGYIMMVLHYLMNIAQPPVIPNLQHLAKDQDAWNNKTNIELFEGFDVRFLRDEVMLERQAQAGQMTRNRESLGSLIRGFFRYYADNRGFHWMNEVISIRTQGGLLTKQAKGWTEAKRAGKNNDIKLRYLFAIEDPFETDHNIARTVGHSGVVAIRDELRRAWNILSKIKLAEGRWVWYKDNGEEGEDLFAKADDRGDLLRQDQDYHKERMKKLIEMERMREAKSKSLDNDQSLGMQSVDGMFPTFSKPNGSQGDARVTESRSKPAMSKLINSDRSPQDRRNTQGNPPPKKTMQVSKEATDTEVSLADVKSAWKDEGNDISKWIEATAEANPYARVSFGGSKDSNARASADGKSPQQTAEIKRKIQDIVHSPTASPLKSSMNTKASNTQPITQSDEKAPQTSTNESRDCLTIDPKNSLSAWNVTLRKGQWLIWRDEKIREGKWWGISRNHPFATVHRQYPFDEARPLPNIAEQNRLAHVRARRNEYFTPKKDGKDMCEAKGHDENTAIDQKRKDSAISMGKSKTAPARKPKPGSQLRSSKREAKHRSTPAKENVKAASTSNFTLALSSNNPEVVHHPDYESEVVVKDALVPQYDPASHGYRHDFPIPTIPDFEFDPAQLRDLGIIAKGGSGCARDSIEQEYGAFDYDGWRNVELSNEWGGGGRMGQIVTDSGEPLPLEFTGAGSDGVDGCLVHDGGDDQEYLQGLPTE